MERCICNHNRDYKSNYVFNYINTILQCFALSNQNYNIIQEDMLLVLRDVVQYLLLVVVLTIYLYTYKIIDSNIIEIVSIELTYLF